MRILLASSSSGSRGGGELFLIYLGGALVSLGHEVTLWASAHSRMDELADKFRGIGPVMRRPYRNTYDRRTRSLGAWFDRATSRRIAPEWEAFDFIHVNKQNLEDGFELLVAARRANRPSVATVHLTQTAKYLGAKGAGVRDFVARRALRAFAGPFAAVLEKRAHELRGFLGFDRRIVAIPNGVTIPPLSAFPGKRKALRVIGVGRMVPQKRPLLFLEEACKLVSSCPDAEVLWVGDGPMTDEWDRAVRAAGMGSKIGRIPWHSDVASLLTGADLFLHVAEYEGLPLAILEAIAAGLPCAISRNLADELDFLDRTTSVVVGEVAWDEFLADRGRLAAMGRAARTLAEERFSCRAMALQYLDLYQRATERC